jgi:hypothetical protein
MLPRTISLSPISISMKKMAKVQIGEKEYSEILITDADGGLIASITDKDVIEEKNCKVVCVPVED